MVDTLAAYEGINQTDEELVQRTRSNPARIARNGLGPVGPVVVRLLVAEALSRRLPNPSNPPVPSC
jgi:hypothetical protein